jgi:hypothetical protein
MTVRRDDQGRFLGHDPNEGCEHRTVGSRAWCLTCTEWCYPREPCVRCERAIAESADERTNPEFVLGAVLAQIEDLEPHQQRQVLIDAMTTVAAKSESTA